MGDNPPLQSPFVEQEVTRPVSERLFPLLLIAQTGSGGGDLSVSNALGVGPKPMRARATWNELLGSRGDCASLHSCPNGILLPALYIGDRVYITRHDYRYTHRFQIKMTIGLDSIESLIAELVSIDSRNPALGSEGDEAGEKEIASRVADRMQRIGLEVDYWEPAPGRPNVVGVLRGRGHGRSLMWNAHLDTVGVEGMHHPFEPTIRNGRLYGRGAQDMKGSLAAQLVAASLLKESEEPLAGDVFVAAVADEEHKSIGTEAVVDRYDPDGAIVTEPTDLKLARAHKGFVWIDIWTRGRAAHGSRPNEGIDANMHMGRVLGHLDELNRALLSREGHLLVGVPSLHAGKIRGGSASSVYAAECHLRMERRTVPGESADDALAEVQTILDALREEDDCFEAEAEVAFARDPLETPADAPIAVATRESLASMLDGEPPSDVGASFWTDAAILAAAGTETVVLGPKGDGLHTTEEWVDVSSVAHLAEVLAETARRYCG